MKIQIKQFRSLRDVTVEYPAVVEGKNGSGKSTVLESVFFVFTGKGLNGKLLTDDAIPTTGDVAEVIIEIAGQRFGRKIENKYRRAKGEELAEKSGTETTYYLNDVAVGMKAFAECVAEVVGDIEMLDIMAFSRKPQKEKIDFLNKVINLPAPEVNLAVTKAAIAEKKEIIIKHNAVIEHIDAAIKSMPIEELKAKEVAITSEIEQCQQSLKGEDAAVKAHNDTVNAEIAKLRQATFEPKVKQPLITEKPLITLSPETIPSEPIKRVITDIKLLELPAEPEAPIEGMQQCPTCGQDWNDPSRADEYAVKVQRWNAEFSRINSYNESLLAQKKRDELTAETEYENAMQVYLSSLSAMESIRSANEQARKDNAIIEKWNADIRAKNADIQQKNQSIELENSNNLATFESDKAIKINALAATLRTDTTREVNAGIQATINEKTNALTTIQADIKTYNNKVTELATEREKLSQAQALLIALERELIDKQNTLTEWRNAFQKRCIAIFGGSIRIELQRDTYSGGVEECCEMYTDRGNEWVNYDLLNYSDKMLFAIRFNRSICSLLGYKNMPLIVDNCEAINVDRRPEQGLFAIVTNDIIVYATNEFGEKLYDDNDDPVILRYHEAVLTIKNL